MARRRVNSRRTRNRWWSGTVHLASARAAAIRARLASNDRPMAMPRVNTINAMNSLPNRVLPHPVILAKRLATIDLLSEGRMRLLTVGLGTLPGEARALGVDFASRGRRADEAIDVLRLLWAWDGRGVSFEGEFFSLDDIASFPKPYASPTLPIHIGGSSRAAARRAGLRGDGYFPGGGVRPAERATQLELMRTTARQAGRDPSALEYTRWASIDLSPDDVAGFAAQGVVRLVVGGAALEPQQQLDEMSELAERVRLRS